MPIFVLPPIVMSYLERYSRKRWALSDLRLSNSSSEELPGDGAGRRAHACFSRRLAGCASCRATADCCCPSTASCAWSRSASRCLWPSACSPRCHRYSTTNGTRSQYGRGFAAGQRANGAYGKNIGLRTRRLTSSRLSLLIKAPKARMRCGISNLALVICSQIDVSCLEPEIAMATECKVVTYNKGL